MRTLSEKEKLWVKQIVQFSQTTISGYLAINILSDVLMNNGNKIDLDFQRSNIVYYQIKGNDVLLHDPKTNAIITNPKLSTEDFLDCQRKIVERAILLKLLIDEGLVYLLNDPNGIPVNSVLSNPPKNNYATSSLSGSLMSVLDRCTNNTLICMQELVDFVQNDFKTEEELKYLRDLELAEKDRDDAQENARKNLRSAYIVGICSPIIAGILGLITGFVAPTTIKEKQFEKHVVLVNEEIKHLETISKELQSVQDPVTINNTIDFSEINKKLQAISSQISQTREELSKITNK